MGLALENLGEGEEYWTRAATDEPTYDLSDEHERRMVEWRVRCFEAAGVPNLDACILAVRRDIDREAVESMIAAGASAGQVLSICL